MNERKRIILDAEASEELDLAADWYDSERAGLGVEFLLEYRSSRIRIAESPAQYARVPRVLKRLNVRRCVMRRFPYNIVYLETAEESWIIAVAHQR